MSKRSIKTENNTMVYSTENDEAETNQEDFTMDFNFSIIMFTLYPLILDDEDNTMPIVHGMALLEIARDIPYISNQLAIVSIVATTAYMLNMDELVRAAHGLLSNDNKIVDEFYADIKFSRDDITSYFKSIDQVLEILRIDADSQVKAMNEICNMDLYTELSKKINIMKRNR